MVQKPFSSSGQTPPKKQTKKMLAMELYKVHCDKPRNEIVDILVKELNTTTGSARTHLSWCIKESFSNGTAVQSNRIYKTRKIDKSGLKRERALEIFVKNRTLSRNEMIDVFVRELKMTWNSAATHCSTCTKEWKKHYPNHQHHAIVEI